MKATTDKSENRKRRRDDSEESIPESSKKAKVHAQRKFAQGAAFINSPVITQIKDKIRPPTTNPNPGPILVGKCPNADGFLTYLCFRKHGIHPDGLTFTPNDSGEENSNSAQNSESSKGSQNNEPNPVNNVAKEKKSNGKKNEKNDGNKKSTPAVQALREKYQEQRLAKQKVSNVTKLAQKVKGKNMVRTRSSGAAVQEIIMVARKQATVQPAKPSLGLRSGLKRPSPVVSESTKKADKVTNVRAGLRSGGNKGPERVSSDGKPCAVSGKKAEKEVKKPKVDDSETKGKVGKVKKPERFSDFSSDDNEPLSASKKPKMDAKKPEKNSGAGRPPGKSSVKTRAQTNEMESKRETKKVATTTTTTPAVSSRPSRKTKEAATVYMEILTKKLVSSRKSGRSGGGLSDESSSSSYLELPNVKKTEQRENEIKAKAAAAKASEKKSQTENKTKETKKTGSKKEETAPKKEVKGPKEEPPKKSNQNSKGDAKGSSKSEENITVGTKRGNRSAAKEEPSKAKSNTQEKNAIVFQPSRPSTRSRPLEEPEAQIQKKPARKSSPQTKEVKATPNKVAPEKQSPTKVIKKSIEKKEEVKGAPPKGKAEEKQGNISKTSSLSSVSEKTGKQDQKSKKTAERGKQTGGEKNESKDKQEKGKEVLKDKQEKGKEASKDKQEKGKEATKDKPEKGKEATKDKPEKGKEATKDKQEKGKEATKDKPEKGKEATKDKQEKGKEATKDKPEKGKEATKDKPEKGKEATKDKPEKGKEVTKDKPEKGKEATKDKPEKGKEASKDKQEKGKEASKDSSKGKKSGDKKQEKKEPEVKKTAEKKAEKGKEENVVSKRPTRHCSSVDKIWIDIDGFTSDEDDFIDESAVAKTRASAKKAGKSDTTTKEKSKSDQKKSGKTEKSGTTSGSSKGKNDKAKETEKQEKQDKQKKEEGEKGDVKGDKESKKEDVQGGGGKQKLVPKSTENKEKVEKSKEKEEKKAGKDERPEKKEKRDEMKSSKSNTDTKSVREASKRKETWPEEGGRAYKRTRPVRQCSTGEKKWIETDSDSFSYYTSEEENEAPIREPSAKSNVKSSLEETITKEKETGIPEKSEKATKKTSKGENVDHFSESDEEPLEKKVVAGKQTTESKSSGGKSDVVGEKSLGKPHREVPALHPLKKIPSESQSKGGLDIGVGTSSPKPNKSGEQPQPNVPGPVERKSPVGETKTGEKRTEPIPAKSPTGSREDVPVVVSTEPKSPVGSVPNRTDSAFQPVGRDEGTSNNVRVTFESVPYQPLPQMVPMPCSYHIKPMNFPPPREPISTHGLDLLSEVALPTTPNEKLNSQTERIEKWLNDSLAVDHKTSFRPCHLTQYKSGESLSPLGKQTSAKPTRPDLSFYNDEPAPDPPALCNHPEHQKFGELELLESQKLLKRNIFAAEMKHDTAKVDQGGIGAGGAATTVPAASQSPPAKKAVTSVQDLLKLQKERREMGKSPVDNSPHLKNCKCNNCVVKKGWFKNKPVPSKTVEQKTSPKEESAKPFQSLTKAFSKASEENEDEVEEEKEEESNRRTAMNVVPVVVSPTPSRDVSIPSSSREGKGVVQQKKMSFLERMKERERREMAARKAKVNAFSPSHESSVYAFEPERDQPRGVSTPFKKKAREGRTPSTSNSKSDDEASKMCEDESMGISSEGQQQQQEKGTLDTSGSSKASQSASIAVQVNLDSEVVIDEEASGEGQDGKSIEISTQTEVPEEDSDSPLFYIPLQQKVSGGSTSSEQRLIQGVALKLGTEGPMGPNQRVIMKAKLVTKAPDSPSIKAVVMPQPKRLFDQKINNPPIGTVQPTARKPPTAEDSPTDKPAESGKVSTSESETPKETASQIPKEASSECSTHKSSKQSPKSASSLSSSTGKGKEKSTGKTEGSEDQSTASSSKGKKAAKQKSSEPSVSPSNSACLPNEGSPSELVEAPTFHPTEKEFQDPFEFFDRIRPAAEKFGLCRIVPPSNFKPDCKVSDDMRFTAYNQYVHRMFHRWGPNIKEMMAIKKYLKTQSISLKQPPWIGGIEVDLPRLYQSVQNCGGLMKVMEKKKWHQVADMMKIPKAAQDRVTKLDDIYCKYLLPYDTLSHVERQKLFDEVEKDWLERQKKPLEESQDSQGDDDGEENYIEECEECVVKGRNMALNQFYRIARNTMSMWFRNPEPSPREVETEFWKHVSERKQHVCVHSGSIDSRGWGYGFPIAKNNSFSRHPWNLKVLTNNSGSVLRSLGPVMGVTVPTIHVGMAFTAFCWYRDPHGLPWIEYLHTGAPKIWYGISDDNSTVFQEALTKLLPRYIKDKRIWLPSDTAMIPPNLLVENGVSLCQTVQEPGQFILVFPRAFTSSICTGYLVSESVYFAQPSWLSTAEQVFKDIQDSCEPTMFSLEKLLFSIAMDSRSSVEVLKQVLPMVWHVRQKEIDARKTLSSLGLKSSDRLPSRDGGNKKGKGRWTQEEDGDYECEVCRMNLYVSLVTNSHEEGVYCLPHAIDLLTQKRHQLKYCKLMYTYTQAELTELVDKLKQRIESKSQKKIQSKSGTSGK